MEWLYISEIDTWIRADGCRYVKGMANDPGSDTLADEKDEQAWIEETEAIIESANRPVELRKELSRLSGYKKPQTKKAKDINIERDNKLYEEFWEEAEECRRTGRRRRRRAKGGRRQKTPTDTREKVLKRDQYTCQKCGSKENLQVHHIKYRSDSGGDSMDNLITLCEKCHYEVHKDEPVGKIMKKKIDGRK